MDCLFSCLFEKWESLASLMGGVGVSFGFVKVKLQNSDWRIESQDFRERWWWFLLVRWIGVITINVIII